MSEALRLAAFLKGTNTLPSDQIRAADELVRLNEANQAMLEALKDIKYGLEGSRIWGGMEWTYNPLHPFKYLPMIEKVQAAIEKGEAK